MKTHFTLLVLMVASLMSFNLNAQCPGCQIVSCQSSVPDGGLCDTAIPPGMANQPYDEDVSFYLPNQATISGTTVTLLRVKILGIGGLPFGLNWESNKAPTNEYFPPNGENDGCVKVCGTPVVPGNYTITVFLEGDVNTPVGQLNNQPLQYQIGVRVLPDTNSSGGAFTFNYSPATGCDTTDIDFTTKFPSNGNPGYSYTWNFGNGNTFNGENPTTQNYPPGTYTVISTVTIDTAGYKLSNISIDGMSCNDCAIFGCLGLPQEKPDPYITLHPNGGGTGASLLNPTPSYTDVQTFPINIPIAGNYNLAPLSNIAYSIKVIDDDNGNPLGGGNDNCGLVVFGGHQAGTNSYTGTGGLSATVTIDHPILFFTDTIQITINPKPDAMISLSKDSACGGDSIIFSVPSGAISYQWWEEGALMNGFTDSSLVVRNNNSYFVEIVDSNNCFAKSDSAKANFFAKPNTGIVVQNGIIYLNPPPSGQFDIQYYLNGVPVPGANGSSYTMTNPGNYTVTVSNKDNANCAWTSSSVSFTSIGDVAMSNISGVNLYPNPNNGQFKLSIEMSQSEETSVGIFDVVGKQVYSEDQFLQEGLNEMQLDVQHLPAGIYMVIIQTAAEQSSLRLIVE